MSEHSAQKIPTFRRLWKKIILAGIDENLSFAEIKKIRLINYISAMIAIVNVLTIPRWIIMGVPQFFLTNITGIVVLAGVIYLNYKKSYHLSRFVFFIYIPLHLIIVSIFFHFYFELFIIPIMIIAGFIFDKKKLWVIYVALLGIAFLILFSGIIRINILQLEPNTLLLFQLISITLSTATILLAVGIFIKQYEENRNEILIKNNMLEASIKVTREKANYAEILFREMNHRVKNNLQLISSLLNIQAQKLTNESSQKALLDAKSRVHSISLVHKQLYKKSNYSEVDLAVYIDDLLIYIGDTVPGFKKDIEFNCACDHLPLRVEDAVSIGLIINELITNSIQHAESFNGEKIIDLTISVNELQTLLISIEDNGTGLHDYIDNESKGFGFELIDTLVLNFEGKFNVDPIKNKILIELHLKNSV